MTELPTIPSHSASRSWRLSAVRVVEELFRASPESSWDDLLDLRQQLLHSSDWCEVLECFLVCRRKYEEDHYLPFYRLRRLLAAHLQLESAGLWSSGRPISLESLLRKRNFSLRRWQKAMTQSAPALPSQQIRLSEPPNVC